MWCTGSPVALSIRSSQIPAQPARARSGVRGEDDFIGFVYRDSVHRRHERVLVANFAGGLNALCSDRRKGEVDANLGGFTDCLVIDHQPG